MSSIVIEKTFPKDVKAAKKFIKLQKKIYKDDENFIPPLKMELLGNSLLGEKGLLRDNHPFHKDAEAVFFIAYKKIESKWEVVGFVSAFVNQIYIKTHNEKAGHFGFFEVIEDYEVAEKLFDNVIEFLKERGMEKVYGPSNFTPNHTWGLLVDPYNDRPYMGTVYNKAYYKDFLEKFGFAKAKDILGFLMPLYSDPQTDARLVRLEKIVSKIKERYGISVRSVDLSKFEDELKIFYELYNEAWSDNWGNVPMNFSDFYMVAKNLKLVCDPGIFLLAYKDDKPVAFIGAVPDLNEMIRPKKSFFKNLEIVRLIRILLNKKKVERVRLLLFGILKDYRKIGLDSLLFYESFKNGYANGYYKKCEISWVLEDNHLITRAANSMNADKSRTWRIFSKDL